jgi:hypothetical protein
VVPLASFIRNRPTRFADNALLESIVDPSGRDGPAPPPPPPGGDKLIVAFPLTVGAATLVALTVKFWADVTELGAVYDPVLLMVPTPEGLVDHVTAVLDTFATVAVNCCV